MMRRWKTIMLAAYPDVDAIHRVLAGKRDNGDSLAMFVKNEVMDSPSRKEAVKRLRSAIADLECVIREVESV